jgi:hypothetical protein
MEVHGQCPTADHHNFLEDSLPTRILDLEMDKSAVQLIELKGQKGRYIALSHYWGGGYLPRTTSQRMPQIYAFESLPNSFQDVILHMPAFEGSLPSDRFTLHYSGGQ